MANWRQAVELAMTDEEIENLAAIARSRSEAARRVERAQILLAYRQKPSFFAVGQRLGLIIRRFNAAWSGRWPMAHWWRLMIGLARARSRRLHPRRKRGWYLWLATRPRITVIRTSCGRRGSWHGMHARTRRRRGTNVLPSW